MRSLILTCNASSFSPLSSLGGLRRQGKASPGLQPQRGGCGGGAQESHQNCREATGWCSHFCCFEIACWELGRPLWKQRRRPLLPCVWASQCPAGGLGPLATPQGEAQPCSEAPGAGSRSGACSSHPLAELCAFVLSSTSSNRAAWRCACQRS